MRIPMGELWDPDGNPAGARRRTLRGSDLAALLRQGPVRFVVAECGEPLHRVPPFLADAFWETEVQPRVVEAEAFDQADFPGSYCYVASEWGDGRPSPLVLLEMYH
jgi:hypothetical protein